MHYKNKKTDKPIFNYFYDVGKVDYDYLHLCHKRFVFLHLSLLPVFNGGGGCSIFRFLRSVL